MQLRILCDGVVDTLGRLTFGNKVRHPFTAHPKVDPMTGALSDSVNPHANMVHRVQADVWHATAG